MCCLQDVADEVDMGEMEASARRQLEKGAPDTASQLTSHACKSGCSCCSVCQAWPCMQFAAKPPLLLCTARLALAKLQHCFA